MLEDGTIIELLFDKAKGETALAVSGADGTFASNRLFTLPVASAWCRTHQRTSLSRVAASHCLPPLATWGGWRRWGGRRRVRAFLHRYVDLTPAFEEIASYYVLLTWVHDAFSDLGYLRLRGDWGTGKTRGLLAIGSVHTRPSSPRALRPSRPFSTSLMPFRARSSLTRLISASPTRRPSSPRSSTTERQGSSDPAHANSRIASSRRQPSGSSARRSSGCARASLIGHSKAASSPKRPADGRYERAFRSTSPRPSTGGARTPKPPARVSPTTPPRCSHSPGAPRRRR